MQVILAAVGAGTPQTYTGAVRQALARADQILGAPRLLQALPGDCTPNRCAAITAQELLAALRRGGARQPVAVFSGDTGFYSGARQLAALLEQQGIGHTLLPGPSSPQLLAALLGRPWQDWRLVSAHGQACDPVAEVCQGRPALFLTGGANTPAALCAALTAAGLGELPVTVGEALGLPGQRVTQTTAAQAAGAQFDSLAVLLAEAAPQPPRRTPGLPDSAFVRGAGIPMTKQLVRAAALAKLAVGPADTLWDVGAGTGSVSVELALAAPRGRVIALECQPEAWELIRANRARFCTWNLELVQGRAPQALAGLPQPNAVFIGGSKGGLTEILQAVLAANPAARVCITAIALETLHTALSALQAHGIQAGVTQLAVSQSRPAGALHLLTAQNPIFLITGNCDD